MKNKSVQITVKGKVQRVGYRYYVTKGADMMSITGFVKNQADGSVYIEAEGDENNILLFMDYCKKGPSHSYVSDVMINDMPFMDYKGFEIKY